MLDITKFPHDIQDKIYSMYFNKHAIIIQKYWRRKDVYLNLVHELIIYLVCYKSYIDQGINIDNQSNLRIINYICNHFSINYKSSQSLYIWEEFIYQIQLCIRNNQLMNYSTDIKNILFIISAFNSLKNTMKEHNIKKFC